MGLPSEKWDADIAPHLRRIRHCAKMAAYYAAQALAAAEQLPTMPKWETMAEANLNEAADKIIKASNALNNKPKVDM